MRFAGSAAAFAAVMGLAMTGLATSAWATNDGQLDNVWAIVNFKAKLNTVDWSGPGPWTTDKGLKVETAKDQCYLALYWHGTNSYAYHVCTVCQDASGVWDWWDSSDMYEVDDEAIGDDSQEICFLPEGSDWGDGQYICSEGYLKLTPKIDNDGVVKKLKVLGVKGKKTGAYGGDEPADLYGSGVGKLKLKVVDESEVPADAVTEGDNCFED